jgi:DNA-binding beta-propeller fold protein YncE
VDSSGNVWVADRDNNRIQEFDSSGTYLMQFGIYGNGNREFSWPSAVDVDSLGNVWVADNLNNRIQEFDSSGTYLTQFGSYGSGNGQFHGPMGVAVDSSGNVWVADAGNNRIQEFSPVPEPSSLILIAIAAISLFAWRRRTAG